MRLNLVFQFSVLLFIISTVNTHERDALEKVNNETSSFIVKEETIGDNSDNHELARFGGGGGGGKGSNKKGGGLMSKILPFMVIPFMISSAMIPMALVGLKFMLLKSAFIGKMAIILLLINMFTRFNNQGGVYSHNINLSPAQKDVAMSHYGYNGDEEYGAYVNRKKRRRRR